MANTGEYSPHWATAMNQSEGWARCVGEVREGKLHVPSCYNRHQSVPIWSSAYRSILVGACVIQLSKHVCVGVHEGGQKDCENDMMEDTWVWCLIASYCSTCRRMRWQCSSALHFSFRKWFVLTRVFVIQPGQIIGADLSQARGRAEILWVRVLLFNSDPSAVAARELWCPWIQKTDGVK